MPADPDALLRRRYGLPEAAPTADGSAAAVDSLAAPLPAPLADPQPGPLANPLPDATAAILGRSVTRCYAATPVPEPLLDTLLACAQSAPSKSDLQQYSILVLRDPARIAAVADWIGTMPWIKAAPVLLVFCGDMRRGQRVCALHGREHANNNLDTFLNTAVDAALAMAHLMAAADAMGLGTCPISYVRSHIEKVSPLLGLPRGVYPVAGLTLGWPVARERVSPRLPPRVVVHRERYDDTMLEAVLPDYDAARPPARPRYPDVHGPKPAGCAWSENMARQLSVPERFGFAAWLRGRGFDLV
ncbi:nitroreductase family protein [Roseomonas sp. NAR14]|uniref:Nitroreductase family protein n=1 Tax=Roseomonas acroporae TaxID=2937791 RepID=A0A9X2BW43_9PROT|nr:nitroreductase family protein [Roseomonas acroporae]MCK8784649.1 nitroreductase family protein [Roseomonas acroporae]